MTALFRRAATNKQREPSLGDVMIAQPLSFMILTVVIVTAVAAGLIFASRASYARKETVVGYLAPEQGIVRVHPPRPGVVGGLHVRDGDRVLAGAPLVSLQSDRTTGGGIDVDALLLASIDSELAEIESRRSLEATRRHEEADQLAAEADTLETEQAAIDRRLAAQASLVRNLDANLDKLRQVAAEGYFSEDQFQMRENRLLEHRQLLASLEQERAVIERRQLQTRAKLARVPIESDRRFSELNSVHAELVRKKAELQARESLVVTAPVAGRVTALRAFVGESVTRDLSLLTIIPSGSRLEAQLFVPTRAIGFIRPEQGVRLLFDAFDYRRFGPHRGTVSSVSASVLLPAETPFSALINEPTYRVTVGIEEQSISAYGQTLFLRAGMSLKADIILEERTLLDWLFDPIVSFRGRQ